MFVTVKSSDVINIINDDSGLNNVLFILEYNFVYKVHY